MNTLRTSIRRLTDRRQWRVRAYLLLGLPLGTLWFGLVVALYLGGVAAQFLLVSVIFLIGAQLLLRPIGRFERRLVDRLLGEQVPAPEPLRFRRATGSRWAGWLNVARRPRRRLTGHRCGSMLPEACTGEILVADVIRPVFDRCVRAVMDGTSGQGQDERPERGSSTRLRPPALASPTAAPRHDRAGLRHAVGGGIHASSMGGAVAGGGS